MQTVIEIVALFLLAWLVIGVWGVCGELRRVADTAERQANRDAAAPYDRDPETRLRPL